MSQTNFTKMHGLGNDFIVFKGPLGLSSELIAKLCDRHTGVGADGLIIVSQTAGGVKMEYWNADGSSAEMCGNGLRCTVRFAVENKLVRPGKFNVKTPVGDLEVIWDGEDADLVEVQVGKAVVDDEPVQVQGLTFYTANVGNPHAVTFVEDIDSAPVTTKGPEVESDQHFPNKTNVEFAQVVDEHKIRLRIWERGAGETLACGTGMVATAAVANKLDKTAFPVEVEVRGGRAQVWLDKSGFTRLRGSAENVFTGSVNTGGN